jgi:aspartyl-tRNA(Asn)/glutamyl-tRNA(Gln) amidotransferase subunit A
LTAGVREVDIPPAGPVADVWNAEIYAYHAPWFTKTPELYQEATRVFLRGTANANPVVYAQARRHVDVVRREIKNVFTDVDLLITPTQRAPAGLIVPAQSTANANRGAVPPAAAAGAGAALNNTAAFDIYGLPTISIPCGFTADGLPIGLQISGAPFAEPTVIALAHAYEQATEWHTRRPPLIG